MVGDAECQRRLGDLGAASIDLVEAVKRSLMHIMPVDPQQAFAVARDDFVAGP
jgi:hypothetical protein